MRVGIIAYGFERAAPTSFVSYTLELAHALTRLDNGPEITLLCTAKESADALRTRFPTYTLSGCRLLPGLMTIGNLSVAAAARALKLDVVHDPNGVGPFLCRSVSGTWRAVVTVHDLIAFVHPETNTTLNTLLQQRWLPLVLRHASSVITVSEHSRQDLGRYLGLDLGNVITVPCGVAPCFAPTAEGGERERLAERYGIQRPYILSLGGLQARKNFVGLLEAWARLRPAVPEHSLVIAGAPAWKYQGIFEAVERLGVGSDVHFTGYVVDADLPALYRHAAAFAFPSLYEGFGRPPLEAMACGVPVVASNTSSLPEVTGDAALLVDPYDIDAIADGLHRVLTDPRLAAELRQNGLARVQHYTWERVARETMAVYKHVLGHQGGVRTQTAQPFEQTITP